MRDTDKIFDDLKPHITEYLKGGDRTMEFMLALTGWMLSLSFTDDPVVSLFQSDLLGKLTNGLPPEAQKYVLEYSRLINESKVKG